MYHEIQNIRTLPQSDQNVADYRDREIVVLKERNTTSNLKKYY